MTISGRFFLALLLNGVASFASAGQQSVDDLATLDVAQASDGASRRVRQIAPELVAPPEIDRGELRRMDPRAPLSDIGPAGPAQPKQGEAGDAGMIFGPVATAAGRIETAGMVIAIAGIEIVEPDQTCKGRNGEWPCGMLGRTAFRSFLRGRALDCDIPEGAKPVRLAVSCRLGTQDLGSWLVANGWAKVSSTGPYAQEQNQALAERRGIFGPGPEQLPAVADEADPVAEDLPSVASTPGAGLNEPEMVPADGENSRSPTGIEPFLREPKGLY